MRRREFIGLLVGAVLGPLFFLGPLSTPMAAQGGGWRTVAPSERESQPIEAGFQNRWLRFQLNADWRAFATLG
jgi:hypothetical protein